MSAQRDSFFTNQAPQPFDAWTRGAFVLALEAGELRLSPSPLHLGVDMLVLCVQVRDGPSHQRDGVPAFSDPGVGQCVIVNIAGAPRIAFRQSAILVFMGYERPALERLAREAGVSPEDAFERLRRLSGRPFRDAIIGNLGDSLPSAASMDERSPDCFRRHLVIAIAARLLTMGEAEIIPHRLSGGLAPWQLNRARVFMERNLRESLPLTEIARTCGLSARHFSRAFTRSTGRTPHDWLVYQRLLRARDLMLQTDQPLSRIAAECGFADLSHFTRSFLREFGTSPGRWRRAATEHVAP